MSYQKTSSLVALLALKNTLLSIADSWSPKTLPFTVSRLTISTSRLSFAYTGFFSTSGRSRSTLPVSMYYSFSAPSLAVSY